MKCSVSRAALLFFMAGFVFASGGIAKLHAVPIVVYNSFGASNSYLTSTAWGVEGGSAISGYRGQAEFFTPSVSGTLTSIQLAMFKSKGSGLCNFSVAQDNGGTPGTILESFTDVLSPNGLLTLTSITQPLLQAGVEYWICAEPADATTVSGWYYNNQGIANGFAFERAQWSWAPISAPYAPDSGVFSVTVNFVPDQISTAALLALALGGCWFVGNPRRLNLSKKI